MAERLDEGDHPLLPVRTRVEHRHGDAQVRQVTDAAFGQVDVVVEEHIARPHLLGREVAHHRMHQRAVGTAGELAEHPIVNAGPEVVRVADHRRARGPPDRGLDLFLDRGQAARHDLEQYRVDDRRSLGKRPHRPSAPTDALSHHLAIP